MHSLLRFCLLSNGSKGLKCLWLLYQSSRRFIYVRNQTSKRLKLIVLIFLRSEVFLLKRCTWTIKDLLLFIQLVALMFWNEWKCTTSCYQVVHLWVFWKRNIGKRSFKSRILATKPLSKQDYVRNGKLYARLRCQYCIVIAFWNAIACGYLLYW